jgi:hypothetical protein
MTTTERKNSATPKKEALDSKTVDRRKREMIDYLNGKVALIRLNGKVRFVYSEDDEIFFYGRHDIATVLENLAVPTEDGKSHRPAFDWWLQQTDRREYSGIVFEPDPVKSKRHPNALNLFRGFAVKPVAKERGCDLYYQHLLDNVCDGNLRNYRYLLDLLASWVQRPGVKVPAPVLVGDKGCGKSIVGVMMREVIGERYTVTASKIDQIVGRFNSHLARSLLVLVEEATYAGDLKSQSALKHLLTGGRLLLEYKGLESIEVDSKCNLIFTSNESTVVKATGGERRFFCLRVANHKQQDGDYFGAIEQQMLKQGGLEALLADLLARDIRNTNFNTPPTTALLSQQIVDSMTGLERWWVEVLKSGELPFTRAPEFDNTAWPDAVSPWSVEKSAVAASAADFARDYNGRPPSPEQIGKFLSSAAPGITASRNRLPGAGRESLARVHLYHLPALTECREAFAAARPGLLLDDLGSAVGDAEEGEVIDLALVPASLATTRTAGDAWDLRNRRQLRTSSGTVVPMRRPA